MNVVVHKLLQGHHYIRYVNLRIHFLCLVYFEKEKEFRKEEIFQVPTESY
jgi:hypothetical protein